MRRLAPFASLGLLFLASADRTGAQELPRFDGPAAFELVREPVQPVISGPIDQRFFGTFCQPQPKEFCKSIPILPDPCVTLRNTFVRMDHITTTKGGLLRGTGRFVLDGKQGRLAVAGSIRSRGRARFVASAPGLGQQIGEVTLSADGVQLTASVQGRSVVLRKDACGNNPPVVTLTAPFGPTFPVGQTIMLAGHISDEDTSFPIERLVFSSNRQGLIRGTRVAGGRTLFTTSLQPGNHRVTFIVTDRGGLTRQASLDLTVISRPPDTPRIFLPAANASLAAGAPVLLQGTAFDPDSGMLTGAALAWSAQLTPGGPFLPLGNGSELGTVFAEPADPVRLRLTATDGTGQSAQVEQQVRVVPSTGNAPPVVVIQTPDRRLANSPYAAAFFAGEPSHLVAAASDVEDAGPGLQLRWDFVALQGLGGPPHPSPPVPNPAPITGTMATDVVFPVVSSGPSLFYRVTFTATDSAGVSSSDSIEVFASSAGPIL